MKKITFLLIPILAISSCEKEEKTPDAKESQAKLKSRIRPLATESKREIDHYAEPGPGGSMPSFGTLERQVRSMKSAKDRKRLIQEMISSEGRERSAELEQLISDVIEEPDRTLLHFKLALESGKTNYQLYSRMLEAAPRGVKRDALITAGFEEMAPDQILKTLLALQKSSIADGDKDILKILNSGTRSPAKNPDELREILSVVTEPEMRKEIVGAFARATGNPSDLSDSRILNAIPEELKMDFLKESYSKIAAKDLSALNQLADDNTLSPDAVGEIIRNQIEKRSPSPEGLDEVFTEAEPLREPFATQFLEGVTYRWVRQNSKLAAESVKKMPPGRNRDITIKSIVKFSASEGDIEGAKTWINSITDPEIRKQLLNQLDAH